MGEAASITTLRALSGLGKVARRFSFFVIRFNYMVRTSPTIQGAGTAPPGLTTAGMESSAPRTPTEQALARVWCSVLGVSEVGVDDGFFEMGGHSLLAAKLVSRAGNIFGLTVPLRLVFDHPRLGNMAEQIDTLVWARPPTADAQSPDGISGDWASDEPTWEEGRPEESGLEEGTL